MSCQKCKKTPMTSKPCSCKSAAATEESTPPDIPTITFFGLFLFIQLFQIFILLEFLDVLRHLFIKFWVVDSVNPAKIMELTVWSFLMMSKFVSNHSKNTAVFFWLLELLGIDIN